MRNRNLTIIKIYSITERNLIEKIIVCTGIFALQKVIYNLRRAYLIILIV